MLLTNLRAGGDHIAARPRFCPKKSPAALPFPPLLLPFFLAPSASLFCGHADPPPNQLQGHPAKLAGRMKRRWRVVLVRAKGEILGTVEAPNAEAAKAAAAVQFNLDEVRRNRIMVQELA